MISAAKQDLLGDVHPQRYNSKQFLVENPIDRYAIQGRDKLKFNEGRVSSSRTR